MADIRYFEEGYATGYTVYTAAASASLGISSSLSVSPSRVRDGAAALVVSAPLAASGDVYYYAQQQLTTTSSVGVTANRDRSAQAQNLHLSADEQIVANKQVSASATLNNAMGAFIDASIEVNLISNYTTWDDIGVTWQTYPGDAWGTDTFRLLSRSSISANGGRQPGLAPEILYARAYTNFTGTVGQTKFASAQFVTTSTVDVEYSRHRFNSFDVDAVTTLSSDAVAVFSPEIALEAAEATITRANAIFEISASASLLAESQIKILVSGEGYLFPTATLSALVERKRSSPAALDSVFSTQFDGIVGSTTPASSNTIICIATVGARGNAIFSGNAEFDSIDSLIGNGRILGFDPYRNYLIDSESRTIRVLPQSQIYTVDQEDAVNTVSQETRGLLVPMETRSIRSITSTLETRRALA